MQSQMHLLHHSWTCYNIINPSADESFLNGHLDMDFDMGECDFSSSVSVTEESYDISPVSPLLTICPASFLDFPTYGDYLHAISLIENSAELKELGLSSDTLLSGEVDDFSPRVECCESDFLSADNSTKEKGEDCLIPSSDVKSTDMSVGSSLIQRSLILPREDMEIDNQLVLPHLLKAYGDAMENEQAELVEMILKCIKGKVSPAGETVDERLAYYLFQSRDNQDDFLLQESTKNYEVAFRAFYQIFPYGKFAHLTANLAILEAMPPDAETIHIVNFDMSEGVQWPPLIEAMGQRRTLRLTSIKWKDEDFDCVLPNWRFEDTKKRLYDYAKSFGVMLQVDEMSIEELVTDHMNRMRRDDGREWMAFNCMLGLPHMRIGRNRRNVMEFIEIAKVLIRRSTKRGIITFGDGDHLEEKKINCRFGSFFNNHIIHFHALFESMDWHFPSQLREARIALDCLFVAPCVSSHACLQKWSNSRESFALPSGCGVEGWRLSRQNLVQAKELVKEGQGSYKVCLEGQNGNEMALEWNGTPLVRVSTWR
ncbi:hypothetical protein IFM89_012860 [Coptis chinensis]|uniref:Nodulation signaling pathway 2-like protein n=1 Tax=Coptis chinensis TaxID=261450 RepID=A0A835HCB8_9MAGN|nr:hypothetical protein IFM89_012860 [Coptis chinensis]